jgi:hypothetical protein
VLEPIREVLLVFKNAARMCKSVSSFAFLPQIHREKIVWYINFWLTLGRLFVSQASCEFLILRNCGMKGGITDASQESSGKKSGSKKGSCEKGREEGAC